LLAAWIGGDSWGIRAGTLVQGTTRVSLPGRCDVYSFLFTTGVPKMDGHGWMCGVVVSMGPDCGLKSVPQISMKKSCTPTVSCKRLRQGRPKSWPALHASTTDGLEYREKTLEENRSFSSERMTEGVENVRGGNETDPAGRVHRNL
jgi:hypothetical protein